MKQNRLKLIIALLVIIIVAIVGGFVFYYLDSKQSNNEKTNQTENNDCQCNNDNNQVCRGVFDDILDYNDDTINSYRTITLNIKKIPGTNILETPIIVYLDPTNLEKVCTAEDVSQNVASDGTPNGIKTGCMKWHLYGEKDNSYIMILAHNTTRSAEITDCNVGSYIEPRTSEIGGEIALAQLVNLYGWKIAPRMLTFTELNAMSPIKLEYRPDSTYYSIVNIEQLRWLTENFDLDDYNGTRSSDDEEWSNGYLIEVNIPTHLKERNLSFDGTMWPIIVCDYITGVRPVIEISKSIIDNK